MTLNSDSGTQSGRRTVFLTGGSESVNVTDSLQRRLEERSFTVRRFLDSATLEQASCVIAVLAASPDPSLAQELKTTRDAGLPLLIIALQQFAVTECLATYRCPPAPDKVVSAAAAWLLQVLDRPQIVFDPETVLSLSPFWSRRLALASEDLQRAAQSVIPVIGPNGTVTTAVAVSGKLAVARLDGSVTKGLKLRVTGNEIPIARVTLATGFSLLESSVDFPNFLPLAEAIPATPLIAALGINNDQKVTLAPGWITRIIQTNELLHDASTISQGAAIVSLDNGRLLGINMGAGQAIPAAIIRAALPPDAIAVSAAGLESVEELADDFFERVKLTPEDYANRNGYDPNFLGVPVPLPKTSAQVELLPYQNFSVALAMTRRLSLYAVVNINGKTLVEKHRAGDPWQLDPRLPEQRQVGGKYYSGTPLDRGHMVRRLDPVWGENADRAELDTFHYPNSCPQHKNLNRKTWNDLEDYIYANLQRDDMKVTVFTGPVLAGDDDVFHDLQLPKEFWKVVVILRDDGQLSATAYLLSQEDMIEGLEFVYGEFRTYQVPVALIEKKTGLDFGALRECDPKAKKSALEAVETMAAEIRGPHDLELDLGAATTKKPAPVVLETKNAWQDPAEGERRLYAALETAQRDFDWAVPDQLTSDLIVAVTSNPGPFDDVFARRVLSRLQRKRRFSSMIRLGDALLQQGFASHQVRRRYAQALIDQGSFHAAESILRSILADPAAPIGEQEEAQGLLGRCGKQMYVNANAPANPRNVAQLQSAINSYWVSYASNPSQNYWHGINVVACLHRAQVDGVKVQAPDDPRKVASDILQNLRTREAQSITGELPAWELATFVEVHVALDQGEEAVKRAQTYVTCKDADAFEIGSTLRQLQEVWRLRDDAPPGDKILNILRAAHLQCNGGSLQLSAAAIAGTKLEKVFGDDRSMSLKWYQQGLERAQSIARIETNGRGFGTGWLVKAADLFPGRTGFLLLTNAHVIGPNTPDRHPGSLRSEDATINFQIPGKTMGAGKVVFHSPYDELDATVLELPDLWPDAVALPLDPRVLQVNTPPQRLYIIGHPGGRDLEFSLQDNHLLAASDRMVHYRTPSEGGSSGSPVFGPTDWKVVALHHAGLKDMRQLTGTGTYEANEGIAMGALQREASPDKQLRRFAG